MRWQNSPNFKVERKPCRLYLALLRQCPCAVDRCYAEDVQAHHLMLGVKERGIGMKVADRYAIPLSHRRHMELHHYGSKRHDEILLGWGVNGERLAANLWHIFKHCTGETRLGRMRRCVMEHIA